LFHFDLGSLGHTLASMFAGLCLPLVLLVVLAGALGGNNQNIGEALADTIGTLAAMIFDLTIRCLGFICIGLVAVLSASVRLAAALVAARQTQTQTYTGNSQSRPRPSKVKLKVGSDQ